MKLKDVEIVVMSDEEYGEHLNQLFERVSCGEIHEPEPHKIMARTAEDIGKILTRERLRLLKNIRENRPESISELARMLKRK
jgi:predicted transcriptional regulator